MQNDNAAGGKLMKNDNAHALRMMDGIAQVAGAEEARKFAEALPLSKSAGVEKKYAWAQAACTYLEERFDEAEIRAIRRECRCNDGKSIAEKLLRYMKRNPCLQDFVADFNSHETFASLEYVSENRLLFCYPACYCACVKRMPGELSRTWCACTLGNAEGIFRAVFGEKVRVELLESIKTGGKRCAIQVTW